MNIPTQLIPFINIITSTYFYIYAIVVFIVFYLFVSLLTWSFLKPLKYLGIPTMMAGSLFISIRFVPSIIISLIPNMSIMKYILPSMLKPILIMGISLLIIGILMFIIYILINKYDKSKKDLKTCDNLQ